MTEVIKLDHLCTDIDKSMTQLGSLPQSILFPTGKEPTDRDLSTFMQSLRTCKAHLSKNVDTSENLLSEISAWEAEIEHNLEC